MRALIVDDSKFIRQRLHLLLAEMGIECAEAEDGREAMIRLEPGEAFDVMLIDWNMPVMDGLECVRRVREQRLGPGMKIMMVTTEADHSSIQQALNEGVDEFLMKPFSAQSLREKLLLMDLGVAS